MREFFTTWDIKDTRNLIVAALLGLIFAYFHWILASISALIELTISLFSKTYVDRLYLQAAKGVLIGEVTQLLLFSLLMPVFLVTSFAILLTARDQRRFATASGGKAPATAKGQQKKAHTASSALLIVFAFGFLIFDIATTFIPARAYTRFDQDMAIIGPYITGSEKAVFLSRWAMMSSRDDYNSIMNDIVLVANSHKVRLPTQN